MSSDPGPAALELRAARLMAARPAEVARDVAVTAAAGDVVAVEGINGSGKSTLLAAAAGLLPAGQGSRHPPTVGCAPERGDTLTTLPVRRWLLGLAQTAGLPRHEAAVQVLRLMADSATGSAVKGAGLLAGTGVVLIALTTFLASRLR